MFYSFIMFKPDAIERKLVKEILMRFQASGYGIALADCRQADMETMFQHYSQNISDLGESFKDKIRNSFDGKCVMPVIISSDDADIIANVRTFIGTTDPAKAAKGTIRGDYGVDSLEEASKYIRCCENLIHASDSIESYRRETAIWFGKEISKKFSNME